MLSKIELYYFNKALAIREIFGFSLEDTKSEMISKNINEEDVKKGLIKRGLLNKDGKLNTSSFDIIKLIEDYNSSQEFFCINETIGSIDSKGLFNYFVKSHRQGEVIPQRIPKGGILLKLLGEISFLKDNTVANETNLKYRVELKDQLIKFLGDTVEEPVYIKKYNRKNSKEPEIYIVYYKELNKIKRYNVLTSVVEEITAKEARYEIAKLFGIEVS